MSAKKSTSTATGSRGRPLTRAEIGKLIDQFRSLLSMIEAKELDATTAMRYRLEGAIAALDVALGRPSSLLSDMPEPPQS